MPTLTPCAAEAAAGITGPTHRALHPKDSMQQLGFDVGGTFTDLVVADEHDNIRTLKVLSTPDDYSRGILDGVGQMVAAGVAAPASVDRMVHAFTVATNALLTRTGARVGLITTRGFRDVLEIGRLRMPQLYNMDWDKPVPLVRRSLRLEVTERLSATRRSWRGSM
ncbi:MAG: hypothetical protein EOO54_28980 [Haliea sp.]|nr:MAG: hypothetical protein EOO54_28980 [Haliea sp.]